VTYTWSRTGLPTGTTVVNTRHIGTVLETARTRGGSLATPAAVRGFRPIFSPRVVPAANAVRERTATAKTRKGRLRRVDGSGGETPGFPGVSGLVVPATIRTDYCRPLPDSANPGVGTSRYIATINRITAAGRRRRSTPSYVELARDAPDRDTLAFRRPDSLVVLGGTGDTDRRSEGRRCDATERAMPRERRHLCRRQTVVGGERS
jgi:hypothetical protein